VHIVSQGVRHAIPRRWLMRAAVAAMRAVGARRDAELEVALTDDATIARLNRRFLGHRGPTDVLTFPGDERSGERVMGEIVISVERARAQARRVGWPVRQEAALLLVHGVLHLSGFDDRSARAAARMRRMERLVLRQAFGKEWSGAA
jgi:probable rRNA maturation factor